jgi:Tfp pilus tip-associated adhesin PilY1
MMIKESTVAKMGRSMKKRAIMAVQKGSPAVFLNGGGSSSCST